MKIIELTDNQASAALQWLQDTLHDLEVDKEFINDEDPHLLPALAQIVECLKKEYQGGTLELVPAKQPEKLRSGSFKTHLVNGMVDEMNLLPIVDLAQPEDEKPSVPEKPEYSPLVSKRPDNIF